MSDELRDSQQHATMSSLKATHVAHRMASEIHSTPTHDLNAILEQQATARLPEETPTTVFWHSQQHTATTMRHWWILRVVGGLFILIVLAFGFMVGWLLISDFKHHPTP